ALAAMPADRHMSAGFDLDLVNQALAAGWYNGGLSGRLEPASGGSIDSLEVEMYPLLPPVVTACAGRDELELQMGAARFELDLRVSGVLVEVTVFSDLALPVRPEVEAGALELTVVGEPTLHEVELLTSGVRLGSHEQSLKEIIGEQLMPDLLSRFGETVLAGIPVPTINLTGASLPGIEMDIEVDFPPTEAEHEEAVIVVISD
ncbi:MAG: hypothetical protein ACOCVR_02855, partial [Myxococcota bacterium]